MTSVTDPGHKTGIDREQLRLAIVHETGVQLPPDDAILTLVAAHEIVLDTYEQRWNKAVERVEKRAAAMGWIFLSAMLVGLGYVSLIVWLSS